MQAASFESGLLDGLQAASPLDFGLLALGSVLVDVLINLILDLLLHDLLLLLIRHAAQIKDPFISLLDCGHGFRVELELEDLRVRVDQLVPAFCLDVVAQF